MDSKSPRVTYQDNNHHQHHQRLLLSPSPRHSSSSSSSSNGLHHTQQLPPPPPYPPKPITRSESGNPYPTTFVQADTNSFKQVVQMLTGSSDTAKHASSNYSKDNTTNTPSSNSNSNSKPHNHIPPIKTIPKKQQQQSGFKLYERRNNLKNLNLNPLLPVFSRNNNMSASSPSGFSPRKHEVLSPSILDFPSLVLSPVTPLIPDPFDRSTAPTPTPGNGNGSPNLDTQAEDKAIKEKGFYLHPSPASTPRDAEPRLLPLFPTTSPRASGSSSSS